MLNNNNNNNNSNNKIVSFDKVLKDRKSKESSILKTIDIERQLELERSLSEKSITEFSDQEKTDLDKDLKSLEKTELIEMIKDLKSQFNFVNSQLDFMHEKIKKSEESQKEKEKYTDFDRQNEYNRLQIQKSELIDFWKIEDEKYQMKQIFLPSSIKDLSFMDIIESYSANTELTKLSVFTSFLTLNSSFIQNVYTSYVKSIDNKEYLTPLGLYYFGEAPVSSGKSELLSIFLDEIDKHVDNYNKTLCKEFNLNNIENYVGIPEFCTNSTIAGIEKKLTIEKSSGFSLITTEKGVVNSMFGQKAMKDIDFLLKGWVGEFHSVARATRDYMKKRKVFGSFFCLTQTGAVNTIFERSFKNQEFSDGLETRCLFTKHFQEKKDFSKIRPIHYKERSEIFIKELLRNHSEIKLDDRQDFRAFHKLSYCQKGMDFIMQSKGHLKEMFLNNDLDKQKLQDLVYYINKAPILLQKLASNIYILDKLYAKEPIRSEIPYTYIELAEDLIITYLESYKEIFLSYVVFGDFSEKNIIKDLIDRYPNLTPAKLARRARSRKAFDKYNDGDQDSYQYIKNLIYQMIEDKELTFIMNTNFLALN